MSFLTSYIHFLGKGIEEEIEKAVSTLLPKGRDLTYLDLGCDDGVKTLRRAKVIGTRNTAGVESIGSRANLAKKKGVKVYVENLNNRLSVRSNSVDCVTATETVEHLVNIDIFFQEGHRILKPGGTIIISTENLAACHNIFALLLGNQPYTGPYLSSRYPIGHRPCGQFYQKAQPMDPHISVMTAKALVELLRIYRFHVINYIPIGFYPFPWPISWILSKIFKSHSSYVVVQAIK